MAEQEVSEDIELHKPFLDPITLNARCAGAACTACQK